MAKKKKTFSYSYAQSLEMLNRLQEMAVAEGNLSLALKAEELKCKIAALMAQQETSQENDNITKILVDFINEKQNSENTGDFCPANQDQKEI